MTTDELFEQLQRDLKDRLVEEELKHERRKMRRELGDGLHDRAAATALAAYRKAVPWHRAYAVETHPNAVREFAALALAANKLGVPLPDVMKRLAFNCEGWQQGRPFDDEGNISQFLPEKCATALQ